MKDTSAANERLYTRMLLALAPEERLAMACRMFSTARTLALAGLGASGPMSAREARAALLLRFYGQDFDRKKLDKISSHLAAS